MFIIKCPYCGDRDHSEFSYGGEAHIVRPKQPTELSDDQWAEYLFMRKNIKGLQYERWNHAHAVSYTQKGTHEIIEGTLNAILELYPIFSRLRMLRQWGGVVDICPDASPIISKTSIKGLYFNCGWGTGGFKATPGSGHLFAHTIARDEPHALNAAFNINRFVSGDLVDEHGAAAVAH